LFADAVDGGEMDQRLYPRSCRLIVQMGQQAGQDLYDMVGLKLREPPAELWMALCQFTHSVAVN
jgi:hypothetical protein